MSNLYNSLKAQTLNKFEWLIVDDGSSDNTESLVLGWQKERFVDIRYIKQQNGGKMSAHNNGVINTKTPLFVCVDSDDYLVCDAVENILGCWNKIENDICGIVAYKGKDEQTTIGNEFPADIKKSTLSGLYEKGFKGDTTLIFKSEILRKFQFPIINNEKFITEAYVYDQIDREYELVLMPKILTVCEYREDGLTNNYEKVLRNNPCGYVAFMMQKGNFAKGIKAKYIAYAKANRFRHKTKGVKMPVKPNNKFLYNLAYPLGLCVRIIKKLKGCK